MDRYELTDTYGGKIILTFGEGDGPGGATWSHVEIRRPDGTISGALDFIGGADENRLSDFLSLMARAVKQ